MQILSIHLKNIKSHRDIELDFSPGINVLSGPNGVGKSTIFEAIGYALFGVDARDFVGNIERFISIGAKRGEIAVDFQLDSDEKFRVTRTVGAASRWLLHKEIGGAFEVEDHASAQETEARLRELLGLDNGRPLADQFKLVIGPFQNDFLGPFVIRQATKRKDAFDEILGIDAWRKTFDGTLSLLKAVQEKIKVLTAEISVKQEQAAVLPEKEKELLGLQNESAVRHETLAGKVAALQAVEERLGALDGQEKAILAAQSHIQVLESRIGDGEGKIAEQQLRVADAEKARKVLEQSRAGKESFEKAEATLKELRAREQQRRVFEQEILVLDRESAKFTLAVEHEQREIVAANDWLTEEEGRLAESRRKLQANAELEAAAIRLPELRQEAERLRAERGLLEGRRASLLDGRGKLAEGICPFFQEPCRNIVGKTPRDVFTTRVEDLDRDLLELDKRLEVRSAEVCTAEKSQKELDALQVRTQELEKQGKLLESRRSENQRRAFELEKLQARKVAAANLASARKEELLAFAGLEAEIAQADRERSERQAARDAFYASRKDAEELESRQHILEKWEAALLGLKNDFAHRQEELALLRGGYDPERHSAIRQEKDGLVGEVATLHQQIEGLGKDCRRLEGEIEKLMHLRQEIENRLVEKKSFEEKERLVTFLRLRVFKNVSAQLSERFREEISLRADRIYRTIAESDEELLWGENYQIVLRDMVEGEVRERSDDQLSGGQTMSAVVALRLALLQTIGARIAFFDEPTSNLDASRRENLAHAFRAIDVGREEVTEHWYDQLFLISHDVAFTEVTDQMIRIGE
jgi:exonuclease SbcC